MHAAIQFVVYGSFIDYMHYNDEINDWDRSECLEKLNDSINNVVASGELQFTYKGKPIKPILPIPDEDCGNLFGEDDYDGPCWDDVRIWFEINTTPNKFKSDNLLVEEHPGWVRPVAVLTYE